MAATLDAPPTAPATRRGAPGWAMLTLLCTAQFMVVLDFSIVNVALPSIQSTFGISQEQLQWLISGYALTFGGFLLLGGRAADLVGRRRMFVIGLVLFAAASLLGGVAPDARLLVAARALQGVAAAVLSPSALSMVTSIFSEGRERHRALGIFGALGAGGFWARSRASLPSCELNAVRARRFCAWSCCGVPLPVLLVALGLIGLGNVCTFVASSVGATSGVEQGDQGLASGVLYSAQQVGSALGISVVAALVALAAPSKARQARTLRPTLRATADDTYAAAGPAAGTRDRASGSVQAGRVEMDRTGREVRKVWSR